VEQRGHSKRMEFYPTFFYGKDNENNQIRIGFFVHQRIIPAAKRVQDFLGIVCHM